MKIDMEHLKSLTKKEWMGILMSQHNLTLEEAQAFIPAMRLAHKGEANKGNLDKLRQNPDFVVAEVKVFNLDF